MEVTGNNIFSVEEETIAEYLKNKYLEHTNDISPEVHPNSTFYTRVGKRIVDLIIIVPIIIIMLPFYALFTVLNLIFMGRPVLYKQTRCGYKGRKFNILKFRSMRDITDKNGRQLPTEKRLTPYGKFIRKFSIDELPNFFNILKGEMSIIGPRPELVSTFERMSRRHKMRTEVRPGLECPRVLELDYEPVCKYQLTFENDIWYVEHVSFLQDIKMFLLLIKMVFTLKKRRGQASGQGFSRFVGYDDKGQAQSVNTFNLYIKDRVESNDENNCFNHRNWND